MPLLDAVEECHGDWLGAGEAAARAYQRHSQALNTAGTGAAHSLSQCPAAVRAEGLQWVNLSSSQRALAQLSIPEPRVGESGVRAGDAMLRQEQGAGIQAAALK